MTADMSSAAATRSAQPETLTLAGVDCDRSFDFTLWVESADSMVFCPLSVRFSELERDAVDSAAVNDLSVWWKPAGISVADVNAFIKANEQAVFTAIGEAYEARKVRW